MTQYEPIDSTSTGKIKEAVKTIDKQVKDNPQLRK